METIKAALKAFFRKYWLPISTFVIGVPIGGLLATGPLSEVFLAIWQLGAAIIKITAAFL